MRGVDDSASCTHLVSQLHIHDRSTFSNVVTRRGPHRMNELEAWESAKHGFEVCPDLQASAAQGTGTTEIGEAYFERMKCYGVGVKGVCVRCTGGNRDIFRVFLGGGAKGPVELGLAYRKGVDTGQLPEMIISSAGRATSTTA
jgi:hypothetical protein